MNLLRITLLWITLFLACGCNQPASTFPTPTTTPVANAGELTLGGETYLLDSAALSAANAGDSKIRFLTLTGEMNGPEPELLLFFTVPESVLEPGGVKDIQAMKASLPAEVKDPLGDWKAWVVYPKNGVKKEIESGTATVTSITGESPWEVDADVVLKVEGEEVTGALKSRVTF